MLFICSLSRVPRQWDRAAGSGGPDGSLSLSPCQAATPPSCAWCAAGPWLRSTAPTPAARMPSVSTAACHKPRCNLQLGMVWWGKGNVSYTFCCIMQFYHLECHHVFSEFNSILAVRNMSLNYKCGVFRSRMLNSIWFWNFKNDLTDGCTFQLSLSCGFYL